jgi:predicted nucleotidyltransferase component of viral defense system
MPLAFSPVRVRQSELLQLVLLNTLYSLSGSHQAVFQGGTALRWVYGGSRFSEDLDFVTDLPPNRIESLIEKARSKTGPACVTQFGPGRLELQFKTARKAAVKILCIYRPAAQRERIAVKLEFERLIVGAQVETAKHILRDLPSISALMAAGHLFLPYTSSIVVAETPDEILSDKIRALYERTYIKGRDIFDLWWLINRLHVKPSWPKTRRKLLMYHAEFKTARSADYFQSPVSRSEIRNALESDLPRFIPANVLAVYCEEGFKRFIDTVDRVTGRLLRQGMGDFLHGCER